MELKKRLAPDGMTVSHVEVVNTGIGQQQRWSARQVKEYVGEGWMAVQGDRIVIKTGDHQDDLEYLITRRPGFYASENGARIPVSPRAMQEFLAQPVAKLASDEARAWLGANGLSGGYEATRNFDCVLEAALHAKYRKEV